MELNEHYYDMQKYKLKTITLEHKVCLAAQITSFHPRDASEPVSDIDHQIKSNESKIYIKLERKL